MSGAKFISLANTTSQDEFMDFEKISFRRRLDASLMKTTSNFLIVSDITTFQSFFESFIKISDAHHFAGALIYDNSKTFSNNFAYFAERLKARALKRIFPSTDKDVIKRIVHAWSINSESELIADAFLTEDSLNISMCDIKTTLTVPISSLKSLQDMNNEELSNFTIDNFGRHIYWPSKDIHLNSDSFKCAIDPSYREKMETKNIKHMKNFGDNLIKLRKSREITQNEFNGLSDKQIRRYEQGKSWPTHKALGIIAKKYDFSISELLNALNE